MPLAFGPQGPATPSPRLRALKDSVRALLDLDDDTTVLIRELACTEPGCPPLETVVAVLPLDGPARRWTLHLPTDRITEDDLRAALITTAPEGAHSV